MKDDLPHSESPLPHRQPQLAPQERRVLASIVSRWKMTKEEDTFWLPDAECICDDLEVSSEQIDVIFDTLLDLRDRGYIVELAGGAFAPTDAGVKANV